MRPKARRPAEPREIPSHLLDDGGRVPSGERLWSLLDHLAEVDPGSRWHDPLLLLTASGDVLDDLLDHPAPPPLPDYDEPEGAPPA